MNEQRNLIIAIALSVAVMTAYSLFVETPAPQQGQETAQSEQASTDEAGDGASTGSGAGDMLPQAEGEPSQTTQAPAPETPQETRSREAVLADDPRVAIDTPRIAGSINLTGGRVDDLTLKQYRQELDDDSDNVVVLEPEGTGEGYYARYGWVSSQPGIDLPTADTRWQADSDTLAVGDPVTLTWTNDSGLTFERTFSINGDYMFEVSQQVTNTGDEPVELFPYGLISRHGTPDTSRFLILHEGPLGVHDGSLHEFSYDDLRNDPVDFTAQGGWLGLTDKYWLVSLIPDQQARYDGRYTHQLRGDRDQYQVDFRGGGRTLGQGESYSTSSRLFAGAKEVSILDRHRDEGGVPLFDKAVDFGWFYFITKPFFYALDFLYGLFGNFGLAIIGFTVVLRIILFPLAHKSFKAMNKMKRLQPEMQELREKFSDDRNRLNQEMMALYKREKVNPAAGCLPILVQIPIFFALYKVLFVTIEMRHTPFVGYLQDLSSPDPTSIFNLFGLLPFDTPDFLTIGFLPIIMGLSLFVQMKLNPAPGDSIQQKIFTWLPIVFTFILARFPAGLVLYWTTNNLLSMLQQVVLMKHMGVPIGGGKKKDKAATAS